MLVTAPAAQSAAGNADYDTCDKGSGEEAIAACGRAIASKEFSGDSLASLYFSRALLLDKKGDADGALSDYSAALQSNPALFGALNNRGNLYQSKGEIDLAIADFSEAIKLKPDFAFPYNNRGNSYRLKGSYDQAIADLNQAIKLKPDYVFALNNRGLAYEGKGDLDAALKDFDEAIRLKPDYANAYRNRGELHAKKHERQDAMADYEKALSLNPPAEMKQQITAAMTDLLKQAFDQVGKTESGATPAPGSPVSPNEAGAVVVWESSDEGRCSLNIIRAMGDAG